MNIDIEAIELTPQEKVDTTSSLEDIRYLRDNFLKLHY